MSSAECLVTYNGKRSDIPFLKYNHDVDFKGKHKDLMFLGWKVGLKGGLKKIEAELGIGRDSGVCGGSEAVRLWKRYRRHNCHKSLKKLLDYNREDVINLVEVEKVIDKRLDKK